MKFLIWFLCVLANAIIITLIKAAGIILGGIPTALLFVATLWLARNLCKKWDEHKDGKKRKKDDDEQKTELNAPAYRSASVWKCHCGRMHNDYESSCVCGATKSDAKKKEKDPVRFCRKCGEKLLDNSRFCRICGVEIIEVKEDEM